MKEDKVLKWKNLGVQIYASARLVSPAATMDSGILVSVAEGDH